MKSPLIIQMDPKSSSSVITRNVLVRDMEGRGKGHVKIEATSVAKGHSNY